MAPITMYWYDRSLPLDERRALYAAAGYPAIASAPVSVDERSTLVAELRPWRIRPMDPMREVLATDDLGFFLCYADPTASGASEIAALECIGPYEIVCVPPPRQGMTPKS
jgi:hypothetical protein